MWAAYTHDDENRQVQVLVLLEILDEKIIFSQIKLINMNLEREWIGVGAQFANKTVLKSSYLLRSVIDAQLERRVDLLGVEK